MLKLSKLDANVVEFYNEKINVKRFIDETIKNLEIPIEIKNQNIVINGDENTSFKGGYNGNKKRLQILLKIVLNTTRIMEQFI